MMTHKTYTSEPSNLFVAKFIGNPIINITEVEIKDGVITHPAFNLPTSELSQDRKRQELADWSLLLRNAS